MRCSIERPRWTLKFSLRLLFFCLFPHSAQQYGQAPPQYAQQPGQYGSPQNTSPQYVPQPQYGSGQPQYGSGPQYGQQPMQTNGQPGPYGAVRISFQLPLQHLMVLHL